MSQASDRQDTPAKPTAPEVDDQSPAVPAEDELLLDVTEEAPAEPVAGSSTAPAPEAEPEAEPETEPEAAPQPTRAAPRVAGAGTMIVGGALAAGIGAAAALALLPEGWRRGDTAVLADRIAAVEARPPGLGAADLQAAIAPLEQRITALEQGSSDLGQRVTALESRPVPDLGPLEARIAAVEARPSAPTAQDIAAAVAPLSSRLDQLESNIGAQARAAVDAAMADARAQVSAQAQAVTARAQDVAAAQAHIAARAALAELVAAAQSGAAVPGALATVTAAVGNDPALAPFADGLVTLAALQDSFAPAARAALASQPPAANAPLTDRLLGFLRSQTGARSLAPRPGNDPDAILSRAEAALRSGDLNTAVSTLDALSGPPAQAMAAWRAQAQTRLDALAALRAVQTRLTGNEG